MALLSIDERLERLTDRHEALTQSVELMRLEGEEQNKRLDKQSQNIDRLSQNIDKLVSIIESMSNIVQSRERRLNNIEGLSLRLSSVDGGSWTRLTCCKYGKLWYPSRRLNANLGGAGCYVSLSRLDQSNYESKAR